MFALLASFAFVPALHTAVPRGGTALASGSSFASLASVLPATGPTSPLGVIGSVSVGGEPEFATFDPTNGWVYVPNWGSNNVTVVNGTHVVGSITVGSIPFSTSYDPFHEDVYVVNEGSNNVSVINGTSVVGTIGVGTSPQFATYNAFNHRMYVSNTGSASVSVINGTSLTNTIPVGTDPSRVVIGAASGGGGGGWVHPLLSAPVIYVPNTGSNNVTVIGGVGDTSILATVHVGTGPQFGTWDPVNVWLYVPNSNSNNVSVLTSTPPYRVLATVPVGTTPFSASFLASAGEVLVVNSGSGSVSVIGGLNTETVVATIAVGSGPEFIMQDGAPVNELLVPNTGSGNVSVIAGTKVVASLPAGAAPIFGTLDPNNGYVYVQNFAGTNLTVLAPTLSVSFKAHGLPPGTPWNVTAGSPPATHANITFGALGTVSFRTLAGPLSFAIHGPAGYGLAKVVGTGVVSQSSANITGPSVISVFFGPLETVYFNESNLTKFQAFSHAVWNVTLTPTLLAKGPASQFASTNSTSIHFTAPAGAAYKFLIGGPGPEYKVLAAQGGVHVPMHSLTHTVKFLLLTSVFVFKETGLPLGTSWTVSITTGTSPALVYPFNTVGTTPSITLHLPAGNYTWSVSSAGHTPGTASGTLVVVVPSAATTVSTGTWT